MNLQELSALSDEELIARCTLPVIREVRGKDPGTKARALARLNGGQRALFLFQVLYGHADLGIGPFFRQIAYVAEALDVWSALKSSFKYFGDADMLQLVERMEVAAASGADAAAFSELDALYARQIPETIARIGSRIRNNPAEFFELEN
jgi:hypothetical protein